jgi:hypothetical protein
VYLLLTVGWLLWGAYQPIFDRNARMKSILYFGNVRMAECQADDDEKEKQAERELKEWNGEGRPPWEQRFPECWRISRETDEEYM